MNNRELVLNAVKKLENNFKEIDNLCLKYSEKVLNAFHTYNVNQSDFIGTTGYGYGDVGRDKIESIFATVLDAQDALVRSQIISGTHAISTSLFGMLRPGDTFMYITGDPYDTLHEIVGIKENRSSLISYNINYDKVELINNDFDYNKIENILKSKKIKLVAIQKSIGYSTRKTITNESIEKVSKLIKYISPETIIFVDNCYCEFVTDSPINFGADIIAGSLIKNLGGGVAKNGGYIAGRKDLVEIIAERLTVPGAGKEVGPSLNSNYDFLKGIYNAPSVVANSLKLNILASYVLEKLGYSVSPKYNEIKNDIVLSITFNNKEDLIGFVRGIQHSSAIDSSAIIEESDMPGYSNKIVMSSGSFISGSSIEISCDGPIRKPYIAYLQGSLTFEYGILALISALNSIKK